MDQDSVPDFPPDGRAEARANLFLAAALHSAGVAHPVRIRDLSSAGARVETFLVPDVGTAATLIRGSLSVDCHVSWNANHFCGLHFCSPVSVHDWMTHPDVFERLRLGDPVSSFDQGAVEEVAAAQVEAGKAAAIARDLARVNRLLETLGEALAGDPEMVARHGEKLHNLGLAMQTLAALAETLRTIARENPAGQAARDKRRA